MEDWEGIQKVGKLVNRIKVLEEENTKLRCLQFGWTMEDYSQFKLELMKDIDHYEGILSVNQVIDMVFEKLRKEVNNNGINKKKAKTII
jgi:hypothetical protein